MSTVAAAGKGEAQNGPRSRKGVQTRARLLDAAKDIFREDGFLEARISDIAERAGLSHGAFYHYFDSKEQIFREIAETLDDRLSEPMKNIIFAPGSSTSPRERLFGALHGHLESYQDEAQIMGVIEQVARYDEHVGAVRASRARIHREDIEASIRRLQRRGLADRRLDARIAAAEPRVAAREPPRSASMSAMTTQAPSCTKSSAVALPIPLAPPLTMATLPASSRPIARVVPRFDVNVKNGVATSGPAAPSAAGRLRTTSPGSWSHRPGRSRSGPGPATSR